MALFFLKIKKLHKIMIGAVGVRKGLSRAVKCRRDHGGHTGAIRGRWPQGNFSLASIVIRKYLILFIDRNFSFI